MPFAKSFSSVLVFLLFFTLSACVDAETAGSDKAAVKSATALPRLVDVGADKCIPCKMMAPILDELEKEYAGKFEVEFVDAWKYREKAAQYRVQMIPTQIFYDAEGKELYRRSGFIGKEDILAQWRKLGYTFDQ